MRKKKRRRQRFGVGRAKRPRQEVALESVLAASKWARRLTWTRRPPANATVDDWIPEFGGVCGRGSGTPPLRNVPEPGDDTDEVFRLPLGCAALEKRIWKNVSRTAEDGGCDFAACVPNLYLMGASKSGTTTLFEALAAHPRVFEMFAEAHTDGETHVFTQPRTDREYVLRAARWSPPLARATLLSLSPNDARRSWRLEDSHGGPAYVMEYTPHYLVLPEARERLCATLLLAGAPRCERAKYVVMLRDPAARAFSQYVMKTHMRVSRYNDPRSFDDAAQVGRDRTRRFAECWDAELAGALTLRDFSSKSDVVHRLALGRCNVKRFEPNPFQAYVLKSAYYYQFLPWFAGVDDPLRAFVVLTLESFGRDELARLLRSLGLALFRHNNGDDDDDGDGGDTHRDGFRDEAELLALVSARRNVARDGGAAKLAPDQRALLDDFFRPMNAKLDALVAPLLGGRPTGYPTSSNNNASRLFIMEARRRRRHRRRRR